jgi:type IV pilus assembly protein PilE
MFIEQTQNTQASQTPRRFASMRGFSLIELLIVIAIIGILAAVALPAYQDSVQKSGRSDGKTSLLSAAQSMERCFSTFNAYNNASCTGTNIVPATSGEGKYTLALTASTTTTFTITATRAAGTSQADDNDCVTMTINQAGQKGATAGAGGDSTLCW